MSEEQEQGQEQVPIVQPEKTNKILAYLKNRDLINLVAKLFILPLVVGALFGLLIPVFHKIFHTRIDSTSYESSFWEAFIYEFYIFFPISAICCFFQTIGINFSRKYKQYVLILILTPLLFFMIWQFGGKQAFEKYKNWINERIEIAIGFGDSNANNYQSETAIEEAISQYKKAVFIDKYLAFWNDNKNLPVLYYKIAKSYGDAEDSDHSIEYIEKSLEAFSEYSPEDLDDISLVYLYGCIIYGAKNDYAMVKSYAYAANEYYRNNYDTVDHRSLAQSYIWLAHAYFNEGDYTNAAECLENGTPLYYDTTAWGFGDSYDAIAIATLYKMASIAYQNIGNQEKYQEYNEKYEDFMWYRDLTESDLDYYIKYFHWMNK